MIRSIISVIVLMIFYKVALAVTPVKKTPDPISYAPTIYTIQANQALYNDLNFNWQNLQDQLFSERGFIVSQRDLELKDALGNVIWSNKGYDEFLTGTAPDSVNPSAWRHAVFNATHGLFKVTNDVYQIRGQSMSNMTVIMGKTGYIVIDPNISPENARNNMDLVYKNLGTRPIVAVIYSHSHVDHFGGVRGIIDAQQVSSGEISVVAFKDFLANAVSENIISGNAMSRRATYMYGHLLPKSVTEQIDAGEGKTTEMGDLTLIPPTKLIGPAGETLTLDGVKMIFEWAPGEAPDEMLIYLPDQKILYSADNTVHSIQNVYTIRGAKTRDSLAWYDTMNKLIKYDDAQYLIQGHNWPIFGQANIQEYLTNQRDALKYVHDQTLRLMNHGYTADEIANMIKLPPELANKWYLRPYYGNIKSNAKAIYTQYLGWYDGNPAHLDPMPPRVTAEKMVDYMGGVDAILKKAQQDYDKGNYQWVVYVLDYVLWTQPDNTKARQLAAAAYTQLAYQAETLTWRNEYLSAARELTKGKKYPVVPNTVSPDFITNLPLPEFFSYLSILLNGPHAFGQHITVNWDFTDTKQYYVTTVENGVLNYHEGTASKPDITIILTRKGMNDLIIKKTTLPQLAAEGKIKVEGDKTTLKKFAGLFDKFEFFFPIVTHEPIEKLQ